MALNLTNQDCANGDQYGSYFSEVELRFSLTTTILIYIIYLIPFCFGVFGNISVCLIFFQQKKLRSITNTFLMNLCLNDLIVLCISVPMTLSSALVKDWAFGSFLCKFLNFTPTLTALVSTFTVAVIAVERWFVIVIKRKFDRRCTIVTLVLLWILSISIALPEFISRNVKSLEEMALYAMYSMISTNLSFANVPDNKTNMNDSSQTDPINSSCPTKQVYFCIPNADLRMQIFSYVVITVQYLVPFLFVSISCYSISRFLKQRMEQMQTYQRHRPPSVTTTTHKTKRRKKSKLQQSDEITEQEFTSCEDLPTTVNSNENKSKHFLTRFRNTFHTNENDQDSVVVDGPSSGLSSEAETILVPAVKIQTHSERRFHRSKKLLICVAALFTISWLPLTVVQIYLEHHGQITRDDPDFVYGFLLIPAYLISSLSAWMNPVIYNYINRSFRREFYALYPCCCKLTSSISRADMSSVIANRSQPHQQQQMKNLEENASLVVLPTRTNKSDARFVTFADEENKSKATLTMINEHV